MELRLEHISKIYKNTTALDDFSMTFSEGIYGLLGPNGAGKSTLMKVITRNIKPTSGQIFFEGTDIHILKREYQKQIGYMPQQQAIYPFYTGRMFLSYMGLLKGVEKKKLNDEIEKFAAKVNFCLLSEASFSCSVSVPFEAIESAFPSAFAGSRKNAPFPSVFNRNI